MTFYTPKCRVFLLLQLWVGNLLATLVAVCISFCVVTFSVFVAVLMLMLNSFVSCSVLIAIGESSWPYNIINSSLGVVKFSSSCRFADIHYCFQNQKFHRRISAHCCHSLLNDCSSFNEWSNLNRALFGWTVIFHLWSAVFLILNKILNKSDHTEHSHTEHTSTRPRCPAKIQRSIASVANNNTCKKT